MTTAYADLYPTQTTDETLFHEALISSIDDVIISTDKNFVIKTWNAAAERIYEIKANDAIGRKMFEIFKHEYIDTTEEQAQKQLVFKNYWKGVVKLFSNNGTIFYLQSVITTVRDTNNKKIGYVGVSRDITSEIIEKQSIKNFESILTLVDKTFAIVDKNKRIIFLSVKGNAQKFFNSDYKLGDHALKYIPQGEHSNNVNAYIDSAFNGEIINYDAESDLEPKTYINITYAPLKDSLNNINNVCIIIKDLTAQKELELMQERKIAAEKALSESRKFFEDFMENSPLLSWVIDCEGNIHYMNSGHLDPMEHSKDAIGKNLFEIYSHETAKEYFEINKKVIDSGIAVVTIEKDSFLSQTATFKVVKFPITFKGTTMVAGWAIDISDQITTQESLLLLNQNKDKIVSVISHDVRAPLGTNRNFINTIIQDFDILEQGELMEYLEIMRNSLTKCYNLTEELLLWGRSQLKSISYNPAELEADMEITKVVENLICVADDKKITIETNFCKADKIYCDHDMFAIITRNFISNAIKFSRPENKIFVSTKVNDDKLVISIKDSGVGIKKELVDKLLRKLNYESTFGTKGEKGAGLGLNIAKDYIDRNNGEMYIESEEGNGSTFSFAIGFKKDQ